MPTLVSDLPILVRKAPSDAVFEVRSSGGELVYTATRREADLLVENGHVEGVATKRGVFRYLRLTVAPAVAMRRLRRMLYSTGRTVSEASQLVRRERGVTYSHIVRRTNTYAPRLRGEFFRTILSGR